MDLEEEEYYDGVELNDEEGKPITWFPEYIPTWKGKAKVTKDPDLEKFMISMPLLP